MLLVDELGARELASIHYTHLWNHNPDSYKSSQERLDPLDHLVTPVHLEQEVRKQFASYQANQSSIDEFFYQLGHSFRDNYQNNYNL